MKAYKKNICIEEFVSRIPGLFPYLEFNDLGELVKHKATDSVDGCYGKMIPDMIIDGISVPYRKLMRDYYDNGTNSDFVDRAIGKFKVSDFPQFVFTASESLVPEYIYAAEAKSLLDEMMKLKKKCQKYKSGDTFMKSAFCCDCDEFTKRGGDKMIELLRQLIQYAESISDEIYDDENSTCDTSYGFSVMLTGSYEDIGYFTPYTENGSFTSKKREFNVPISPENDYTVSIGINSAVSTDSKLKSLRCYTTYMNASEQYEQPTDDEDWLYFYQKGYVANYETVNDDNGNIATINDEEKNITDKYVINLMAYGSLITDIDVNADERTITFTYYINAHLKAKPVSGEGELDMYKFPFKYESGGVKQTETYFYPEDGEIDTLVKSGKFYEYISLDGDGQSVPRKFETMKCAFSTMGSTMLNKKMIWGKNADIGYQISSLEYERDNNYDVYDADIFKEDYLIGVHFKPSVENKVNIRRGNNAAFERHIRLGEVKTLEDMENYMNGSFFNIQQVT